jgi:hypothetical protein
MFLLTIRILFNNHNIAVSHFISICTVTDGQRQDAPAAVSNGFLLFYMLFDTQAVDFVRQHVDEDRIPAFEVGVIHVIAQT